MSTDAIVEILRSHENPCAVLERHAPLFEPFDLGVAMHYARAHYAKTPRIYTSLVFAALNAASEKICWEFASAHYSTHRDERIWGVWKETSYHVRMRVMLGREGHSLLAHYLHEPLGTSDVLVLSIPFIRYHYVAMPPSQNERKLFARCVEKALGPLGAHRYIDDFHLFDHDFLVENALFTLPLSAVAQAAPMLIELIEGQEIFARRAGEFVPGPLARQVGRESGLSEEDLLRWVRNDYEEVDPNDIPF